MRKKRGRKNFLPHMLMLTRGKREERGQEERISPRDENFCHEREREKEKNREKGKKEKVREDSVRDKGGESLSPPMCGRGGRSVVTKRFGSEKNRE